MGSIDSIFAVATDGTLVWNNDEFTARFGADSEGILYGVFSGSFPGIWTEVILKVVASKLSIHSWWSYARSAHADTVIFFI